MSEHDEENRFNTTQEISSKSWRLQDHNGNPVLVGQPVSTRADDMEYLMAPLDGPQLRTFELSGGEPPHKPSSTGRVYGTWSDGGTGTYFPNVFNLKWVDLNLEVGEDLTGEEAYL